VGEVRAACDLVCLSEVVDKMPNGFESRLHYQGANLSGGQRQRIALARALLKKPKALILDESTNAIDDATKTQILTNIKLEYRDKILIFITHDTDVINIVDHCVDILKESN
jgi:ABC-type bacteriocin/lantibiotic exporter with double-glycine peptidase domain